MKLSVVMPYAGSSTLQYALSSLRNQVIPKKQFELVLVGEHDAHLDYRAMQESCEFEFTYIRYRRKKSFRGHSAGVMRNLGVEASRSDVIMFMDSDCIVGPLCLLRHCNFHAALAAGVNCGGWRELSIYNSRLLNKYAGKEFKRLLRKSTRDFRELTREFNSWENFYSGNASVPKYLLTRVGGFDESGYRCHDLDVGYRLFRAGARFQFSPECEAIHIEHPRSAAYRLEQAQGWRHLGDKHPEIRPLAEDRVVSLLRAFERVTSECEDQFSRAVKSLPGLRIDRTWVVPGWCTPQPVNEILSHFPHFMVERESHRQGFLRLDRNCWDFSIIHVGSEILTRPEISVLITTFNSEGTVARAIESVLNQTLQSFEIIVIDDGSTDETEKIVRSFAVDGRVRLLLNHKNRGLSRSLNRGLEACRGRIVVQLDSDDWLESQALEAVHERMQSNRNIGAVYARAVIQEGDATSSQKGYQIRNDRDVFEYPYIQAPRAYRVDLLRNLGGWRTNDFFEGRYFEDRLTLARVSRAAAVSFIDAELYHVELGANSLSRRDPFRSKIAKLLILSSETNARRLRLETSTEGRILQAKVHSRPILRKRFTWSVVIPAHNRLELLEYSLRSWIESDANDGKAEIIVVDDGSSRPLRDVVRSVSKDIRYVRIDRRKGPAEARNLGASLARYTMLFFCDADRIVPPDVIRSHEAHHRKRKRPRIVVGGLFGRKVATFFRPSEIDKKLCRMLFEQFRFDRHRFIALADSLLGGGAIRLVPETYRGKLWDSVEELTYVDPYLSQWAPAIIDGGWEPSERHRFLRVGTGNLSISSLKFRRLGGFDSKFQPMEDWEFGVRAIKSNIEIVSAAEAEPYHQLHEVDPYLVRLQSRAMTQFRRKHPAVLRSLLNGPFRYEVPGVQFIRNMMSGRTEKRHPGRVPEARSSYCALTFDDGPHPVGTVRIMEILRRHRAVATFFVLGALVSRHAGVLRQLVEAGCELGVHGWIHQRVDEQTTKEIADDLSRTVTTIREACGKEPRFCRPSYGLGSPAYLAAAQGVGLQPVGWHVSSNDWQDVEKPT